MGHQTALPGVLSVTQSRSQVANNLSVLEGERDPTGTGRAGCIVLLCFVSAFRCRVDSAGVQHPLATPGEGGVWLHSPSAQIPLTLGTTCSPGSHLSPHGGQNPCSTPMPEPPTVAPEPQSTTRLPSLRGVPTYGGDSSG